MENFLCDGRTNERIRSTFDTDGTARRNNGNDSSCFSHSTPVARESRTLQRRESSTRPISCSGILSSPSKNDDNAESARNSGVCREGFQSMLA